MKKPQSEFGIKLRSIRKEKGITQKVLADKAGMSFMTIQRYESGERTPKISDIERIASALCVPWQQLIAYTDFEITPTSNGHYFVGQPNAELTEKFRKNLEKHYPVCEDECEAIKVMFAGVGGEARNAWSGALLNLYDELNDDGQNEALKRVEELTQIPKYQKRQD